MPSVCCRTSAVIWGWWVGRCRRAVSTNCCCKYTAITVWSVCTEFRALAPICYHWYSVVWDWWVGQSPRAAHPTALSTYTVVSVIAVPTVPSAAHSLGYHRCPITAVVWVGQFVGGLLLFCCWICPVGWVAVGTVAWAVVIFGYYSSTVFADVGVGRCTRALPQICSCQYSSMWDWPTSPYSLAATAGCYSTNRVTAGSADCPVRWAAYLFIWSRGTTLFCWWDWPSLSLQLLQWLQPAATFLPFIFVIFVIFIIFLSFLAPVSPVSPSLPVFARSLAWSLGSKIVNQNVTWFYLPAEPLTSSARTAFQLTPAILLFWWRWPPIIRWFWLTSPRSLCGSMLWYCWYCLRWLCWFLWLFGHLFRTFRCLFRPIW